MSRFVVTPDRVRLAVDVAGPADARVAVVLVHGWCLSSEIFRHQVRALADHPVRVVSYDKRGHGRSGPAPDGSTTIAHAAEDLRLVIDEVCRTLPVVLVGHSLGGMTIMALAESDPERFQRDDACAGVVFVNTAAGDLARITLGLPTRLAALASQALPREFRRRHQAHLRRGDGQVRRRLTDAAVARYLLFGRDASREAVALGRRLISTAHPGVLAGYYHDLMAHDRHTALEHLATVPVRILAGTRDRLTPPVHSLRIARALPHARLSLFPGAGHMIPLERPDELTGEVLRLARRTRRTTGDP